MFKKNHHPKCRKHHNLFPCFDNWGMEFLIDHRLCFFLRFVLLVLVFTALVLGESTLSPPPCPVPLPNSWIRVAGIALQATEDPAEVPSVRDHFGEGGGSTPQSPAEDVLAGPPSHGRHPVPPGRAGRPAQPRRPAAAAGVRATPVERGDRCAPGWLPPPSEQAGAE